MPQNTSQQLKPFIKWAGGKGKLLKELAEYMPFKREDGFTYVEPFVGGGALLFWMLENFPNLDKAIVNDINLNLIHTYKTIREHPADLIEKLGEIEKELNSIFDNSGKASLAAKKRALYYVVDYTLKRCFCQAFFINFYKKFS